MFSVLDLVGVVWLLILFALFLSPVFFLLLLFACLLGLCICCFWGWFGLLFCLVYWCLVCLLFRCFKVTSSVGVNSCYYAVLLFAVLVWVLVVCLVYCVCVGLRFCFC